MPKVKKVRKFLAYFCYTGIMLSFFCQVVSEVERSVSSKSTVPGTGKQCKLSERTRQRANNKPERCPAHRRRYDPQHNYHLATNAITAISPLGTDYLEFLFFNILCRSRSRTGLEKQGQVLRSIFSFMLRALKCELCCSHYPFQFIPGLTMQIPQFNLC